MQALCTTNRLNPFVSVKRQLNLICEFVPQFHNEQEILASGLPAESHCPQSGYFGRSVDKYGPAMGIYSRTSKKIPNELSG